MKKHGRKGFTIIELLVTIGLFSVIVAIAAGGFTSALRAQRQVAALISAQANAGLALEQIAREARTGYLFCHDTSGVPTCSCTVSVDVWTCSELNFINGYGTEVNYAIADGGLTKKESGGAAQPVTSDNVFVSNLTFRLFGHQEGDHWTPRITILMGVSPSSTDPVLRANVLNLQTTVSARTIDCTQTATPNC